MLISHLLIYFAVVERDDSQACYKKQTNEVHECSLQNLKEVGGEAQQTQNALEKQNLTSLVIF